MKRNTINTIILILLVTLINDVKSLPSQDLVPGPPGFINQTVYSGYLKTANAPRQLHYVFLLAEQNSTSKPLTVWFNGGPGCSSLIGFIQQLGPYLVGNKYNHGESLTRNQYAWNKASNMLFIQSPGIVGYSSDTNHSFQYTDKQTAQDAFAAIKDFIFTKASQFKSYQLFLAGQSYAGKYIPDITNLIMKNNDDSKNQKINLKGILIGNGVMSFLNDQLQKSQMQFLGEHSFMDLRLWDLYQSSCGIDFDSPRCKYVRGQVHKVRNTIDIYNVFEVCKDGVAAQAIQLQRVLALAKQNKNFEEVYGLKNSEEIEKLRNPNLKGIIQCPSDDGAISYFNEYKINYHADKVNKTWSTCTYLNYDISYGGSMKEYESIFLNKDIKVWLYVGDWDDQVPFTDTVKNLKKLGKTIANKWQPWFVQDIHAGFVHEEGDYFSLITVKRAGHMVPQNRPKEAYQMFYNFIHNQPVNHTIPWF